MSKNKPTINKIGYINYKISYVDELKDDDNEDLCGKFIPAKDEILIHNKINLVAQKATLVHETIHGIEDFTGIELTEEQVIALGNMLFLWMNDNKNY